MVINNIYISYAFSLAWFR